MRNRTHFRCPDSPRPDGWQRWFAPENPVRLGVSSCLAGHSVRYDGGHKHDAAADALRPWVEWVPVCPEVEVGMGVPRPPIQLERRGAEIRLLETKSRRDHTRTMEAWARRKARALRKSPLDGFVLKSKSPSCGLRSAKVFSEDQTVQSTRGTGLFATSLVSDDPTLPVEEERSLKDHRRLQCFAERIFARNRWRSFAATEPTRASLFAFHEAHKFLLWCRDETAMRRLGRLLAEAGEAGQGCERLVSRYGDGFLAAMASPATRGGHVNVLQHAQGYLKRAISPADRQRVASAIEEYRQDRAPRETPLGLLRRFAGRREVRYLLRQIYFSPVPEEIAGPGGDWRSAGCRSPEY